MHGARWVSWMVTALVISAGCGDSGDTGDNPASTGGASGTGAKGGAAGASGAAAGQAGQGGSKAGAGGTSAAGQGGKAGGAGGGAAGSGGSGQSGAGTAGQGGASGKAGSAGSAAAGSGGSAAGGQSGAAGDGGAGGESGAAGDGGGAGDGGAAGEGGASGEAGASGTAGAAGGPGAVCCTTSVQPGCDGLDAAQLTAEQMAVQACVCAADASCCTGSWADSCVSLITMLGCGASCDATQGPCQGDADCDDKVFCNGVEVCQGGKCAAGTPPVCDDGVSCTEDFCDQQVDACKHNLSDVKCSDGLFCNGIEACDPANGDPKTGCVVGKPVVCDDGIPCTVDACDDATGACVKTFSDGACDNGVFCDGQEQCTDMGCVQGTLPTCDDGIGCTVDGCDEGAKACTHTNNPTACDDGLVCNGQETCDPTNGDPKTGCVGGDAVPCASDGVSCTIDACNESTGVCEHKPDNTLCGANQFCVPGQGNSGCTAAKPCTNAAQCDDGDACNGKETCNGVCQPGVPVNCDDGIVCTVDSCTKATGVCTHAVNDTLCDDGLVCNGVEKCDTKLGCMAGTKVNCNDGFSCTIDVCQEPTGTCVSTPADVFCDDGKLCNGAETCDPTKGAAVTGCVAGKPYVCPSDGIACTNDVCDPALDACVSKPDNTKCSCGQTCDPGKGGCGNFCQVKACSNGKVYACGDCKDNDGDCKIDSDDTQCLGACDNTENAGPTQTSGCYFAPPPGQFSPKQKCAWNAPPAGDPYPAAKDATMTPVVINLTDDNGDGKIDTNDTPDIAFISYPDTTGEVTKGVLRVVSGKCNANGTMKQLWSVGTNEIQKDKGVSGLWFDFSGGLAAGDIDSDGVPDLVASLAGGGTIAISNQGKVKWIQQNHPKGTDFLNGGTPAIANLDAAGDPEIITGRVVLNGKDGTLRWKGTGAVGNNGFLGPVSSVADIDLDGKLNVLAGNTAYNHDGTVLWTYKRVTDLVTTANCQTSCDGFTASGNFDADNRAEVVIVSAGRIFLVNHDGTPMKVNGVNVEIAMPIDNCTKNEGGPPTIADFDGDGQPEIGVAGSDYYMVADLECLATPLPAFCSNPGIRWKVPNNDCSSRVTGSSVFDFDGDGNAEVIYNDETNFRIFDGKTGTVLFQQANHSRTRLEMPIVADVDNDGKADVVFVENDANQPTSQRHGLRVWADATNSWVSTRRIWNQHAYHVTNVSETGVIPVSEKPTWLEPTTSTVGGRMNNFRQNLPEYDALSAPDLTTTISFTQTACPASLNVVVKVCNQGLLKVSAGIPVSLYNGATQAALTCANGPAQTTQDLNPGACQNVTCQIPSDAALTQVRACADNTGFTCTSGGSANECNEANNATTTPVQGCPQQ